jgi:hypothetical protein
MEQHDWPAAYAELTALDRRAPLPPADLDVGLDFQYAIASASIQGVDRDARFLAKHLSRRTVGRAIPVDSR